jgi:hypothetical protein
MAQKDYAGIFRESSYMEASLGFALLMPVKG